MRNNAFLRVLFVLPFVFFGFSALAQNVAGENLGVKSYKKISSDTLYKQNDAVKDLGVSTKAKTGVVKKQSNSVKLKSQKIDTLDYSAKVYRLGERVIMPGDSGRDVRSVAKILINKIYIDEESLTYTSDGGVLYQGELLRAVKHFQEFNGFHPDGIIGHDLIKALRKRK